MIYPSLALGGVLYVPKLSHNLLSVSKGIYDMRLVAIFNSDGCVFRTLLLRLALLMGLKLMPIGRK